MVMLAPATASSVPFRLLPCANGRQNFQCRRLASTARRSHSCPSSPFLSISCLSSRHRRKERERAAAPFFFLAALSSQLSALCVACNASPSLPALSLPRLPSSRTHDANDDGQRTTRKVGSPQPVGKKWQARVTRRRATASRFSPSSFLMKRKGGERRISDPSAYQDREDQRTQREAGREGFRTGSFSVSLPSSLPLHSLLASRVYPCWTTSASVRSSLPFTAAWPSW